MMEFIVEDGTGKPDATSLVSVEYADAYFSLRGNANWAGTPTEKQGYLVIATDYACTRFNYKSSKLNDFQALEFPRDAYGLPANVLKAVCEYAVLQKQGDLILQLELNSSGLPIVGKTETLGPMSESTQYANPNNLVIKEWRKIPIPDNLLKKYSLGGSGIFLQRG